MILLMLVSQPSFPGCQCLLQAVHCCQCPHQVVNCCQCTHQAVHWCQCPHQAVNCCQCPHQAVQGWPNLQDGKGPCRSPGQCLPGMGCSLSCLDRTKFPVAKFPNNSITMGLGEADKCCSMLGEKVCFLHIFRTPQNNLYVLFNRPGVAGDVLQTPLWLIN